MSSPPAPSAFVVVATRPISANPDVVVDDDILDDGGVVVVVVSCCVRLQFLLTSTPPLGAAAKAAGRKLVRPGSSPSPAGKVAPTTSRLLVLATSSMSAAASTLKGFVNRAVFVNAATFKLMALAPAVSSPRGPPAPAEETTAALVAVISAAVDDGSVIIGKLPPTAEAAPAVASPPAHATAAAPKTPAGARNCEDDEEVGSGHFGSKDVDEPANGEVIDDSGGVAPTVS